MERNRRMKGVLHFIFFRYRTIVVVLGFGHSCRAMACSCKWLSWGGLYGGPELFIVSRSRLAARMYSVTIGSGREGDRINADRKFSSGWIQGGGDVSISFQFCTDHLPRSHSSCTCPLVNSMMCLSSPCWKGAAESWCCVVRCLFSRLLTAPGLLRKAWMASVCSWNSTRSGLGSGRCLILPQQLKIAAAMSTCARPIWPVGQIRQDGSSKLRTG